MWLLYQLLYVAVLLAALPYLLLRRGSHYLPTLPGRLSFPGTAAPAPASAAPSAAPPEGAPRRRPLWIHAVSVGEVAVAETLVRSLPPDEPLLVTTVTPTGQAQARRRFTGRATVAYLPFEIGLSVRAFFRRHRPRALVLVEGDYWPRVLREARRRGLPVTVVNGRIGDASFRRLRGLRGRPVLRRLLEPLFAPVGRFGVQSGGDRQRLLELGVEEERIGVTGNLKFDTPEPAALPDLERRLGELAAGRPVLLAGSTMAAPGGGPPEEERVVTAFRAAGGGERAMLVLAPRHPERWDEVERLLASLGVAALRRSRLAESVGGEGGGEEASGERPDVVLLDSLGELAALYRLAAGAFIGGTLVPSGGHNPLEPARFGVPVVVGPSLDNFRDMAALFRAADAWREVADADGLGRAWSEWLDAPAAARQVGDRARRLVEENRGSVARTLELLEPALGAAPQPVAAGPGRETAERGIADAGSSRQPPAEGGRTAATGPREQASLEAASQGSASQDAPIRGSAAGEPAGGGETLR